MTLLPKVLQLDWWLEQFRSVAGWALAATGVLLLCGGLIIGAFADRKELATAIVFATTLLGTAILSLMLPKVLAKVIDDERVKARMLREKLDAEMATRLAQEKRLEAEREIERLNNQRVSVDQIEPVLKLALIKVPCERTDFVQETVKASDSTRFSRREELEYLGVFDVSYTQVLGVDLNRLRFKRTCGNVVEVHGLAETELIGVLKDRPTLRVCELRKHCTEGTLLPDSHEILTHDPDGIEGSFNRRKQKQLNDIDEEIKRPKEGKVVNEAIGKMALQFLETYFRNAGISLVKATTEFEDGRTLVQICDDHNTGIDRCIAARREEK